MPLRKNFDKNAIISKVKDNKELGQYAAETLYKYVSPYVPYRTGRLCNDVTITPYKVKHNAPYANEVYNNLKMNFNKEHHPLATARWYEVALPAIRDYLIADIQDYVNRMDFND